MSQFNSPGFAAVVWQGLRRPSTWILLGAGLLAADRLRWLPAAWTDATLLLLAALLSLTLGLARLLTRTRAAHRREVQVLALPLSPSIEPDTRRRLLLFFLFMLALVLVPALFG